MESHRRGARWPVLLAIGILAGVTMGNDAGGCIDTLPLDQVACTREADCEGLPHIACAGEWQCLSGQCVYRCLGDEPECAAPSDCEGLVHPECVGAWDCSDGACSWNCATEPIGCHGDGDCAPGSHCSVSDGDCGTDPDCPMCAVCYGQCVPDEAQACVVSGCSGQICAAEPMDSDCMWLDWYACLAVTECGAFGADGACGFQRNDAFDACVQGVQCSADGDCPDGYECPVVRCGEDDPSLPAERCIGVPSFCTPKAAPAGCTDDSQCPPGQFCAMTPDCPPCADGSFDCMGPCELVGVCVPVEEPLSCQGDQDCPVGHHCEWSGGCPPCDCAPEDPACSCPMCMPPASGWCVPNACCEDKDGDGFCVQVDCDDGDSSVNLLAPEVCDGRDNDCDGLIDEGCGATGRKCGADSECYDREFCRFGPAFGPDGAPICCLPGEMCLMYLPACVGECAVLPGYCWTDADCASGERCEGAIVCPPGAMCFAADRPGECVAAPTPSKCASDADCAEGQACRERAVCPDCVYADPPCLAPCGVEAVCVALCWTDSDCIPGEYCDILRCGDQRCAGPYECRPYLPD